MWLFHGVIFDLSLEAVDNGRRATSAFSFFIFVRHSVSVNWVPVAIPMDMYWASVGGRTRTSDFSESSTHLDTNLMTALEAKVTTLSLQEIKKKCRNNNH